MLAADRSDLTLFVWICPCRHTFARDKIQNSRWPWSNIVNNNNNNNNNNKPIIGFLFARTQFTENMEIAKKVQVGVRFKDVSYYTHLIL